MKNFILTKKGFILLSILLLSLLIIIIIIPLVSWTVNEYSWTSRSFMALRALNLADAGAELAIWDIVYNDAQFAAWSGVNPKTRTIYSFQDNGGGSVGDIYITVQNTSPGHYLITSTGFVPDMTSPKARKTVKVKVFPHALFNNGVFGYSSVAMSGNALVDSYDSTQGPYSIVTARSNGDVGTNGTLSLIENASVHGDAMVGPDGVMSGVTSANVTGETFYSGNDVEKDIITVTFPNATNLKLTGKETASIPPGPNYYKNISLEAQSVLTIETNCTLYVSDNFSVGGMAVVITNAGVKIYIGGSASFAGGGIVNATQIPGNLAIYGVGAGSTLSYSGGSDFYGTIHAPESDVSLSGNAAYFGAVLGDRVTMVGGAVVHYDESLATGGPFSGYDIAYWQEN